ncbi:MAG: hypothetical protein IPP74_14385 [Alphaproteobacteria bacterium]|nr:hypothetical protein [Alphaproteobacteria bacterium]
MSVIVKTSLVKQFHETMAALVKKNLYVGIPEANNKRKDDIKTEVVYKKDGTISKRRKITKKEAQVTNAQLGYINENGSAAKGIPPRPFLKPGVEAAAPEVMKILGKAAITTDTSAADVDIALEKAGQKARDVVKNRVRNSVDIEGLSEVTKKIRATRKKNRRTGVMKPLIDTAQMLNSITYVIREG